MSERARKSPNEPALLLLDKPAGMTSFDCIRELKHGWKRTDFGHGGTLDRFATGLLPILMGEGLKLVRFFLDSHPSLPTYWKTYSGVIELGKATETGDPEGAVTETRAVPSMTGEQIQAVMETFVAREYLQTPPAYSAKKIQGERASELARKGITPELKPVSVTIRKFEYLGHEGSSVRFRAVCSKGTYIRVLALDFARRLDTAGFVSSLRRDAVGDFQLSQAITLADAQARGPAAAAMTLAQATAFLPAFPLLPNEDALLAVGKVDGLLARLSNSGLPANIYCARAEADTPAALLELTTQKRANFLRAFV